MTKFLSPIEVRNIIDNRDFNKFKEWFNSKINQMIESGDYVSNQLEFSISLSDFQISCNVTLTNNMILQILTELSNLGWKTKMYNSVSVLKVKHSNSYTKDDVFR